MTMPNFNFLSRALVGIFRLWQLTFSAVFPPSCRFTPSCSAYGIEAVQSHGAAKGGYLTFRRLMRCHPFSWLGGGHGHDPVPPRT
jgi:uncharacterized protein